MRDTVKKWRNTHGVRLPKSILEEVIRIIQSCF